MLVNAGNGSVQGSSISGHDFFLLKTEGRRRYFK